MRFLAWTGGTIAALAAAPAAAQVAIEVALQSDYRLRGYSLSDGNPAASVTASYDDASGIYVAATAIGTFRDDVPELLSLQGNLGYAVRVSPRVSLDAGVYHAEYFSGYGTNRNYDYTEFYAGVAIPHVAARVRFSPDYFRSDTPTLYAEVDGGIELAPNWLLSGHAGVLHYLEEPLYSAETRYDWRLGVSRQVGALGLHLDVTGRIVEQPYFAYPLPAPLVRANSDKTKLVGSLTYAF